MSKKVVVSIVVFRPNFALLQETVESVGLSSAVSKVVITDNSSLPEVNEFCRRTGCEYLSPERNIGFGAAHNFAFARFCDCEYFLVLNPDVRVHADSIERLVEFMGAHPDVGLSTARVLNPDGSIQYAHKRLPTLRVLFGRRFLPKLAARFWPDELSRYELRDCNLDVPLSIPSVSGCFMLFRTACYQALNGFDERYFMYQEDIDISRRANQISRVIYYPSAVITHHWARGSHKKLNLTLMNIVSVFKYYCKWGLKNSSDVSAFHPRKIRS